MNTLNIMLVVSESPVGMANLRMLLPFSATPEISHLYRHIFKKCIKNVH